MHGTQQNIFKLNSYPYEARYEEDSVVVPERRSRPPDPFPRGGAYRLEIYPIDSVTPEKRVW